MIKLSVLYIEDNPYDADLVNAYLEQTVLADFSVTWVKGLKEAILQIEQHDFHVVLLDFDLPRIDPFDSLRSLKQLGKSSSIVIYTSLAESDRALESLKIGADDFLLKENVDADSLAKSLLFAYQRRERTKALEETNSQLQKFNAAAEQSANTVVITNIKGEIEYVNQKFVEVTGYTKEEVIGKNPRVLKSGKQDRSYYEELWQTVLSGKPWKGKFENIKKNGTPFWEEAVISPIINKEGEITHFVANKENVTEIKFLSDELEATLKRLERSHDIAKLGSFEYDFERQEFIHVCKHVADLLPVDIELFFQDYSSCAERFDCDCGHSNQLERCRREEQSQCIYYIPSKEIYIEITSQPLLEKGKLKKCSGTIQNVTDSVESGQEITRQRDQFRSFFESETVGVLHIDVDGNVQEVNQAMIDLLGLESKSQYPKNVFEVEWGVFHRDGAKIMVEELPAYRSAKHGEVVDNSLMGMQIGESVRWLDVRSSPIKDDNGIVDGAIVILNDLTSLITAENVIRENEQKLRLSHTIGKIGISELNLKTGEYFWSDELCDIFEIPHKKGPVELSEFEKFIVPEDIERVMSGYAKDLETRSDGQVDYRIRTPKGKLKHINADYRFLNVENKELDSIILGVIHDVTDLKKAEKVALESEKKLVNILKSIRDKIIIFNEKDEFIGFYKGDDADPPMVQPEKAMGRSFVEVFPKKIHDPFLTAIEKVRKNGQTQVVNFSVPMHGGVQAYEAHISLVPATLGHVSVLARNITKDLATKAEIESLVFDLGERVKEANTLQKISELSTKLTLNLNDYLVNVWKSIAPGFLYPELTKARITFQGERFGDQRLSFKNKISEDLYLDGMVQGSIEVAIPVKDKLGNPLNFLTEEKRLLTSIAENISLFIQNYNDRQRLRRSETKYKSIITNLREGYIRFAANGEVLEMNDSGKKICSALLGDDELFQNIFDHVKDLEALVNTLEPVTNGYNHLTDQVLKASGSKSSRVLKMNLTVYYKGEEVNFIEGTLSDETERYYLDQLRKANIKIFEASQNGLEELIQVGIDQAVDLLESNAGFYHFVDEDKQTIQLVQWSMGTKEVCKVPKLTDEYKIEDAGIWVECISSKEAVVHNDYDAIKKKGGLPQGHFPLKRDLEVPILLDDQVVAIIGVANKETPYGALDIELLQSFTNQLHSLVRKAQIEKDYLDTLQIFEKSQRAGNIGSWEYDAVYDKIWWSDLTYEIYGLPAADGPPENWLDYTHPEDQERHMQAFSDSRETGEYELEFRLIRPDGEERHVSIQSDILFNEDGSIKKYLGIIRDITAEKKSERSLIEQKELFESIVISLEGFVYHINENSQVQYVSKGVSEVLGFKVEEVEGLNLKILDEKGVNSLSDISEQIQLIENVFAEKGRFNNIHRLVKKSGDVIWVSNSGTVIESNSGSFIQGYVTDVTDKVRAEETMMNAVMNASDSEKARISKDIHDGLQQTLTIAALNLEFAKTENEKLSKEVREKFELGWEFLKKGMEDSRAIAHKLMPKAIEDFGLVSAIRDLVNNLIQTTAIEFEFYTNMEGERLQVAAETNLFKLIQESVNNILKHSEAKYVSIQYIHSQDRVSLTIEDDGKGFDVSRQARNAGFGLASMRSRATALGASFNMDSTPGHGTTLIVEVPFTEQLRYYE